MPRHALYDTICRVFSPTSGSKRKRNRRSLASENVDGADMPRCIESLEQRTLLSAVSPGGSVTVDQYEFREFLNPPTPQEIKITVNTAPGAVSPVVVNLRTPIQSVDNDIRTFFNIEHTLRGDNVDLDARTFTIPAGTRPSLLQDNRFGPSTLEISGAGTFSDDRAIISITVTEVIGSGSNRQVLQTLDFRFLPLASSPDVVFDGAVFGPLDPGIQEPIAQFPIQDAGERNTATNLTTPNQVLNIPEGGRARVNIELNQFFPENVFGLPVETLVIVEPVSGSDFFVSASGDGRGFVLVDSPVEFGQFATGEFENGVPFPPNGQFFAPDVILDVVSNSGVNGRALVRVSAFQAGINEFVLRDSVLLEFNTFAPADLIIDAEIDGAVQQLGDDEFTVGDFRTSIDRFVSGDEAESFVVRVQNQGTIPASFRLKATNTAGVNYEYRINSQNITNELLGDGFLTPEIPVGEDLSIRVNFEFRDPVTEGQVTSNVLQVFALDSETPLDEVGLDTVAVLRAELRILGPGDTVASLNAGSRFTGSPLEFTVIVRNAFLDFPASLPVSATFILKQQGRESIPLPDGVRVVIRDASGADVTSSFTGNLPHLTSVLEPGESTEFAVTVEADAPVLLDNPIGGTGNIVGQVVSALPRGVSSQIEGVVQADILLRPDLIPNPNLITTLRDTPSGQNLVINYQVGNDGVTLERRGKWFDLLVLDINGNGIIDSNDHPLGTVPQERISSNNLGNFAPGETYADVIEVLVNQLPDGEFRILLQVDAGAESDDGDRKNNVAVSNTTVVIENNLIQSISTDDIQVEQNDDDTASVSGSVQDTSGSQTLDVRLLGLDGQIRAQQQLGNNGGALAFNFANVPNQPGDFGILEIENEQGGLFRQLIRFAKSFDLNFNFLDPLLADVDQQRLFLDGSEIVPLDGSERVEVTLSSTEGTFTRNGSSELPSNTISINGNLVGINNDLLNEIEFSPNAGFQGIAQIVVHVEDTDDPQLSFEISAGVTVTAENRSPEIRNARAVITRADGQFQIFADVSDPDGDAVTVTVTHVDGQPLGSTLTEFPNDPILGLSTDPGVLPDISAGGPYPDVTITATDSTGLSTTQTVRLFIADPRVREKRGDARHFLNPGSVNFNIVPEFGGGFANFQISGSASSDAVVIFRVGDATFIQGIDGTSTVAVFAENEGSTFGPREIISGDLRLIISTFANGDDVLILDGVEFPKSNLGSTPGDDLMIIQNAVFTDDLNIDVGPDEDVGIDNDQVFLDNVTVAGNTAVQMGNGDDRIDTTAVTINGNLEIRAGAGSDHIDASGATVGGETTIDVATGNDNVIGTPGDDIIRVADGGDTIDGGGGNDLLIIDASNEPLVRIGNQIFIGDQDSITLTNIAAVTFENSAAEPLIIDLSDDDDDAFLQDNGDGSLTLLDLNGSFGGDITFVPPAAGVVVNGLDGDDIINLSAARFSVTLNGDDGDDALNGGRLNDELHGGEGDDTLIGFLGADQQFGDAGDDLFIWNNGDGPDDNFGGDDFDSLEFNGADGADDVVRLAPAADVGAAGDGTHPSAEFDLTRTAPSAFTIENSGIESVGVRGLGGNDSIDASLIPAGLLQFVLLLGDDGNDVLRGTQGIDTLGGGDGNDTLIGNRGNDIAFGDSDALLGIATGNTGDDLFIWNNGDGADDFDGESGNDTFQFNGADGAADTIRIAPAADVGAAGDGTLPNASVDLTRITPSAFTIEAAGIENFEVNGLAGDDIIDASLLPAGLLVTLTLNGDAGNDLLTGSGGIDVINGGADNDTLIGFLGADQQHGDAGNDRFIWNNGDGPDDNFGDAGTDTFEFNGADAAADDLRLAPAANVGAGGDGTHPSAEFDLTRTLPSAFTIENGSIENAEINGLGGDDILDASSIPAGLLTSLTLDGSDGNDTLIGSAGDDVLIDGMGNDSLNGGAGDDVHQLTPGSDDIVNDPSGNDTLDFTGAPQLITINPQSIGPVQPVDAAGNTVQLLGGPFESLLGAEVPQPPTSLINLSISDDDALLQDNGDGTFTLLDRNNSFGGDLTFMPDPAGVTINGLDGGDNLDFTVATFSVTLNGNDGDDRLFGGRLIDAINGGDGDDTLIGFLGADQQHGDAGNDRFIWNNGDGPDDNFGGDGDDTFEFNGADGAGDRIRIVDATDIGETGDGTYPNPEFDLTRTAPSAFTIENATIENILANGRNGDDVFVIEGAFAANSRIDGGAGNDVLDATGFVGAGRVTSINVEQVEQVVPAEIGSGDVRVRIRRGTVSITGDKNDNNIRLFVNADGETVIQGQGGTTVNGSLDALVLSENQAALPGSLRVRLNGGDDTLVLDGIAVGTSKRHQLKIDGGSGTNMVLLNGTQVAGKVVLKNSRGTDERRIENTQIGASLVVRGSGRLAIRDSEIQDRVNVRGGGPDNSVLVQRSAIRGRTSIRARRSAAIVALDRSEFGDDVFVTGGRNRDLVGLFGNAFAADLTVRTTFADDLIGIEANNVITGRSRFIGGTGRDALMDDGTNTFGAMVSNHSIETESNDSIIPLIDNTFNDLGDLLFATNR